MRRLALLAFALVLAAACAGLASGPAAAKDFSITAVNIDATVRPNGDLRVHESRTLDFSGSFSFVYWDLSTKGSSSIDVTGASGPAFDGTGNMQYKPTQDPTARPPGTYFVSDLGGTVRVQLFFSVTDSARANQQRNDFFEIALKGAGILGLLVGGIGIANTMQESLPFRLPSRSL